MARMPKAPTEEQRCRELSCKIPSQRLFGRRNAARRSVPLQPGPRLSALVRPEPAPPRRPFLRPWGRPGPAPAPRLRPLRCWRLRNPRCGRGPADSPGVTSPGCEPLPSGLGPSAASETRRPGCAAGRLRRGPGGRGTAGRGVDRGESAPACPRRGSVGIPRSRLERVPESRPAPGAGAAGPGNPGPRAPPPPRARARPRGADRAPAWPGSARSGARWRPRRGRRLGPGSRRARYRRAPQPRPSVRTAARPAQLAPAAGGRSRPRHHAALTGGLQAVPRALHAELAGHRRAVGHLHHLLRHHQRGGLHPALLGGRQREHPQAWLLRPLPLLRGQRAGGPRAHLPGLLHRLQYHPIGSLQGGGLLRAALHGADPRLHHLLCPLLLLQHGHGLQDLRLDAALGSPMPGPGLHDLPRRLGRRDDPGHVWGQDWEVLPGGLFSALGVHPGHHRHPQRPHPLLPRLRAGQPANRPSARGPEAGEQRLRGLHSKLHVAARG